MGRKRYPFLVDLPPESRDVLCNLHCQGTEMVPVIVEDIQGFRGFMRIAVEVGEHLLQAVKIFLLKEQDADAIFSQRLVLLESCSNSCGPMLPIINDKLHL